MASTEQPERTQSIRRVVAASFIGTTIEWYDFFLYGTAAALVFNKLFFPKQVEPVGGPRRAAGAPARLNFLSRARDHPG